MSTSAVAQCRGVLGCTPCRTLVCSYYESTRADGRPRRDLSSNSLDGTIPASLSALNSLQELCVRAAAAQYRSCRQVFLRVPRTYPCTAVRVSSQYVSTSTLRVPFQYRARESVPAPRPFQYPVRGGGPRVPLPLRCAFRCSICP